MKVYLDNGATTMVDVNVAKVVQHYMTNDYGNAGSIHQFGESAKDALEKARNTIAKSLNANATEIIFTSGGTESDNIAIRGVLKATGKKHIITSRFEHHAVLKTCEALEKKGYKVTYLGIDKEGFVNLKHLEDAITKDTALVSIIHANNEVGTIQDLKKIGEICRNHDTYFHTDAVQSYTKVPIDTKKIKVDLISLSAHKIHGPKGIGALYVRKGIKIKNIFDGGEQEFGLRPGTENVAGAVGFAKAVELAKTGNMEWLRDRLIDGILKEIPDTFLNGSRGNRLCNNANITFKYVEGEAIVLHLSAKGIAVSTGSACTSHSLKPSHVLTAMGLKPEDAHGSIRFTLSRFTTPVEISYTIKALKEVITNLRRISPFGK